MAHADCQGQKAVYPARKRRQTTTAIRRFLAPALPLRLHWTAVFAICSHRAGVNAWENKGEPNVNIHANKTSIFYVARAMVTAYCDAH